MKWLNLRLTFNASYAKGLAIFSFPLDDRWRVARSFTGKGHVRILHDSHVSVCHVCHELWRLYESKMLVQMDQLHQNRNNAIRTLQRIKAVQKTTWKCLIKKTWLLFEISFTTIYNYNDIWKKNSFIFFFKK